MEPVGARKGFIAVNPDDIIQDIVTSGSGAHALYCLRGGHLCDHRFDRFATLHFTAAHVEDAVGREGRDVEIGIVKIEREETARLKVFDGGAVIRRAAP